MRRHVHLGSQFLVTVTAFCLLGFVLGLKAGQIHRQTPSPSIEENGFFYGQKQLYFVTPPLINVYYPAWRSGFRHEIFVVRNGKWVKKWKSVSQAPPTNLDAQSCDGRNGISVVPGSFIEALPSKIRIKQARTYGTYALVVYSDRPEPSEYYPLSTSLLILDSGHWKQQSKLFSGDSVQFCGTEAFWARLSDTQSPELIFLVYLGDLDHSGGKFISIQSFVVRD